MEPGSQSLHVMHILGNFGPGGAEMGVVRLIGRMNGSGMRHSVCSVGTDVRMRTHLPKGVPCYALGIEGPAYGAFFHLAALFRRTQVHIAHVNNLAPWLDVFLASRLARCRCVETFHGIEDERLVLPVWKRALYRMIARHSDAVTAVSHAAWEKLHQLTAVSSTFVRIIANGIDETVFAPFSDPAASSQVRHNLGLPENACLFACVAALRPVKNHHGLLRAFARAFPKDSLKAVGLVLIGSGSEGRRLQEEARALGVSSRVYWLGHRDDVAQILPAMDVFVLNSWTEGLSYAVLEAMACGLPVCATHVGSNPDLVADGREGFLYPPGSDDRLAERLQTFYQMGREVRRAMGASARQKVLENYSLSSMVQGYNALYRRIIRS